MTKKNWIRQLSESYIRLNEANYYKIHPLGKIIDPKEFAKLNPRQRMEAGTFAREQGHTITIPHLLGDEHFRRGYGDGPSDDEEYFAPGLGPG